MRKPEDKLIDTKRQTGFVWKGHTFIVESEVEDKYLFLASSEKVYLDGKKFIDIGGFTFKNTKKATFTDSEGVQHVVEFRCSSLLDVWLPVSILIDDQLVYTGGVRVKGLVFAVLIYFPIFFSLTIMLLLSLNLITISLTL